MMMRLALLLGEGGVFRARQCRGIRMVSLTLRRMAIPMEEGRGPILLVKGSWTLDCGLFAQRDRSLDRKICFGELYILIATLFFLVGCSYSISLHTFWNGEKGFV
mmetsp:Transcript_6077/g.9544  ORF Transcript_6077/g.9544 Transcript_6077/m.9544 type:complete len:105 (-) Transcript_6077:137-451(-)